MYAPTPVLPHSHVAQQRESKLPVVVPRSELRKVTPAIDHLAIDVDYKQTDRSAQKLFPYDSFRVDPVYIRRSTRFAPSLFSGVRKERDLNVANQTLHGIP